MIPQKVITIAIPEEKRFHLRLPITANILAVEVTDTPHLVVLHPHLEKEEIKLWKVLDFVVVPTREVTNDRLDVFVGTFQITGAVKLVKLGGEPAAAKSTVYSVFYTEREAGMGEGN
jgi:hypothetical protein